MEKKKMRKGNAVAAGSIAGKKKGKSILSNWQLYVMVLPAIIYFILFHYKPMYGIVLAFKKFNMREGIMGSPWVGLENFERLFSSTLPKRTPRRRREPGKDSRIYTNIYTIISCVRPPVRQSSAAGGLALFDTFMERKHDFRRKS